MPYLTLVCSVLYVLYSMRNCYIQYHTVYHSIPVTSAVVAAVVVHTSRSSQSRVYMTILPHVVVAHNQQKVRTHKSNAKSYIFFIKKYDGKRILSLYTTA